MKHLLPVALHLAGIAALAVHYHQASRPLGLSPPVHEVQVNAPLSATAQLANALEPSSPSSLPATLAGQMIHALRAGTAVDRDRALYQLLPRLIAEDPAAAGRLALGWEPGSLRDELLRQLIRHWAEADIAGVLMWLTSLLNVADRNLAATASTVQVATDDPAGALDLAQVLRVGLDDGSFEHLAQIWTEEHPRAAVDWTLAQPAGPLRDRLLARIAWVRAQGEPAEAAGLVLNHMRSGEAQSEALLAVLRQWAVREPAEAAEWSGHFPTGSLQTRAIAELEIAAKQR
ncbi:MAG: hypothetical protein ACOZE5_06910 [Verrucomicrobiota bacterium]